MATKATQARKGTAETPEPFGDHNVKPIPTAEELEQIEWETQSTGLGRKLVLAIGQPEILTFNGPGEGQDSETGEVFEAFLFTDHNGDRRFMWQSYELRKGFEQATPGQKCRITYLGDTEIDGGFRVKNYRIELAK